jgi:hypothetical protein
MKFSNVLELEKTKVNSRKKQSTVNVPRFEDRHEFLQRRSVTIIKPQNKKN